MKINLAHVAADFKKVDQREAVESLPGNLSKIW